MKYLYLLAFFLILTHCNKQNRPNPSWLDRPSNKNNPPNSNAAGINQLKWSGSIKITGARKYQDLLQLYGICNVMTWNYGDFKCSKWDSSALVELVFTKESLPADVELKIIPQADSESRNPYFRPSQILSMRGTANFRRRQHGLKARLSHFSGRIGGGFPVIIQSKRGTPKEQKITIDIFYGGQAHKNTKIGEVSLENLSKPVFSSEQQVSQGR